VSVEVELLVEISSSGCAAFGVEGAGIQGLFFRLRVEEGSAPNTCRLMRHI